MELKLDIYNKKEVEKTYTCDTYDLMFGTIEDFLELVNVDELKTGSDAEILVLIGKALPKGKEMIKTLFKDVFEGITDEELKNTRTKDMTKVLLDIIKYSIAEIGIGVNEKK